MQPTVAQNASARQLTAVTSTRVIPWTGGTQLLTETPRRQPPVAGTIHAGAKVLTKANSQNTVLVDIYSKGMLAGNSYNDIEEELKQAGGGRNPLRMVNLPYFNVRRGDFRDPSVAERLLALYGTDVTSEKGTKRRLQRFPIMFPTDDENLIVRHSLAAWSASTIRFWSESRDGERFCMTKAMPEKGKRQFGGRENVVNPERPICQPKSCPEYQSNACNLTGALQFYVPGIQGTGLLRLPTRSFYALDAALAEIALVRARRGSVAGLIDGKPFFYISKQRQEVSWLSPNGPTRVWQDVIVLESDMDMVESQSLRQNTFHLAAANGSAAAQPIENAAVIDEISSITLAASQIGLSFDDVNRLMSRTAHENWTQDEAALDRCLALLGEAAVDRASRESLLERVAIMGEGATQ